MKLETQAALWVAGFYLAAVTAIATIYLAFHYFGVAVFVLSIVALLFVTLTRVLYHARLRELRVENSIRR